MALGALAWGAGRWVRVAPPDAPLFVTLLAEPAANHEAGASRGDPIPPSASDAAARAPAAAPRVRDRTAAAPPSAARRDRAPGAASPRREPLAATQGSAPLEPAPARRDAPSASAGGGATPAARAAARASPAPGSSGGGDRVYDEGEVDRAAAPIGGIRRPEYPARERLLGREGRVSLLVEVDAAGAVRDVRVARSAGEAFDASARRAVERTPFRPARLGDRAVASTVTVNVTFELD